MKHLVAVLMLAACACARVNRSPILHPNEPARGPVMRQLGARVPAPAGTAVITQPAASDLEVFGHGPEARALIEHYPQANAVAFQFFFRRGVCVGDPATCRGGGSHGAACSTNADCASGPLTFTSGETEFFDADGNSLGVQAFNATEFDASSGLNLVGICNGDNTIACSQPGMDDADACGSTGDDACNNRPAAGYVPDHAAYLVRNPKELVAHNLVPAEAELRVCFAEFDTMSGCDPLIVRQAFEEYRVPPGQTYIYPLGNPNEAGGLIKVGVGHEPASHHRGVNNQRHAYDIGVVVGGNGSVPTSCQSNACVGGARNGQACADGGDCIDNTNAYVYNEPILAMADGTIVAILHDYPENPNPPDTLPGVNDCDVRACGTTADCDDPAELPTTGNSVFIQYGNGEVSHYAHTIPGTNNHLDCGDAVAQGDVVGNAGNSGNSSGPHLHFGTDKLAQFWDGANYSFPSYYTNVVYAAGPDPTPRRQLDSGMLSGTVFSITGGPTPLPRNAPVGPGAVAESEPNDTLAGHDALDYPVTVAATLEAANVGDLAVRGDGIEDVYRIDVTSPDELRIALGWQDGAKNLDVYLVTEDLRVMNETGQGTQRSGTEEAVCPELEPGAYYLMVTNLDTTKPGDEPYELGVDSDPQTIAAAITNAVQPIEVDTACEATVEFTVTIHDNCCLDPDTLELQVFRVNPTNNLTLGTIELDLPNVLGPRDIEVTGRVAVSDVTSCPAEVVILAQAKDCSGNLVSTDVQGTNASTTVVDLIPPQVEASDEDLFCLWPPQHSYVCFTQSQFAPTITDNCAPAPTWQFDACTSDQPDDSPGADGPRGDGHTVNDCVLGAGNLDFCARAERAGSDPDGRRYALDIEATDACGNVSTATTMGNIYVPHDQNPGQVCVAPVHPFQDGREGRTPKVDRRAQRLGGISRR
ncbi:MAG TPA: peptidoglycan DD-metalloendopeptidase family protein [Candidatus Polarisedimenticolaceae bacterium]|nr:peptidoglycan DD-metalloendopeptidase family protein [Candidatus Polarisedimenticolaceae bacterium]